MWLSYPHHNTREPRWIVLWISSTKIYLHQIQRASQVHSWDHIPKQYEITVSILSSFITVHTWNGSLIITCPQVPDRGDDLQIKQRFSTRFMQLNFCLPTYCTLASHYIYSSPNGKLSVSWAVTFLYFSPSKTKILSLQIINFLHSVTQQANCITFHIVYRPDKWEISDNLNYLSVLNCECSMQRIMTPLES
jgi:hypothetical protein